VRFLLKLPRRALLLSGAVLVVVILWGVHMGLGWLHRVNSASFTLATVGLTVNNDAGSDEYTALNLTSVIPGASLYTGLTVANTGSSGFRYSMSTTASGNAQLASSVRISIAAVPVGGCNSSAFASGTVLFSEARGLPSASIGARLLSAGTSEYLCFHVRLPLGMPNSLQGDSAQATFNFTAQQS
jgi:hypothetical protein